ncbi:MAG: hypothetical protein H7Y22_00190 [Gemmatimonadaceae bacterium]|nr:hypothetical protein [Gloeobacterales cyanobacterium ES-bin-141]
MSERMDTLQQYVSDMLALERHIFEAVKRQTDDDHTKYLPEATRLIGKIEGMLGGHISETEQHLSSLGGDSGSPVKDAVAAVTGIAAGLIDKVRSNTVSKMLRDDYAALSLDAMGYTMLHTTGLALQHSPTADLALRHLYDLTPLIVEISEVIPLVVAKELLDDGETVDASVGPEAVRNTQKTWKNEVVR